VEVVEVVKTVDNTQKLLAAGAGVIAAGAAVIKLASSASGGEKAQDFLEASPYWDQSTVPVNVYKNKTPFTGKVVSTKRIVGPKATGETCHIVIDHKGNFPVSSLYAILFE
jgi:ferredoxin--NADP+ reductase